MAEWLYEAGIGECRAALIDDGRIIIAEVEPKEDGPRAGAVMNGRLRANRIVDLEDGDQALLDRAPDRLPEGATLRVIITRSALSEPGKVKRAKARAVAPDTALTPGETLRERISATEYPVTTLCPHDPDALETAGWSELLERAQTGIWPFPGGALHISLTPAMTLIDIDGQAPVAELAVAGMQAAAQAICCLGITGSIGIDVPTLNDRALRALAAAAMTDRLERPYEATAINGFGFMQIIRPRHRASLMETLHYDRTGSAARALLRQAQRSGLTSALTLVSAPRIMQKFEQHPHWLRLLGQQVGGTVSLRADASLSTGSGYVCTF